MGEEKIQALACYLYKNEPHYLIDEGRTIQNMSLLVFPLFNADETSYKFRLGEARQFGIDAWEMDEDTAKTALLQQLEAWRATTDEVDIPEEAPLQWLDTNPYNLLVKHG